MFPKNLKPQFNQPNTWGNDIGISFNLSQKRLKLLPRLAVILALALVYYGTAEISRLIASTPQSVTPVWPPDGFAVAATLIFGYQILPGVFIGSFLANIWAFFDGGSHAQAIASLLQVIGIAIGTTLGASLGNFLLRRTTRRKNPLKKLGDAYKFLILTGCIAPISNATFGITSLCLAGNIPWSEFAINWLIWWISNVSGICIFTPALISWYGLLRQQLILMPPPHQLLRQIFQIKHYQMLYQGINKGQLMINSAEMSLLVVIILTLSYFSFFQAYDLEYMLLPCVVWSVIRFGQFGATNLIVIITTIAVLGTVRGFGSFVNTDTHMSLVQLQSFIIVIVLTTLSLTAILTEKQQAIAKLQQSESNLLEKSQELEASQDNLRQTAVILEQQNFSLVEAKKTAENANKTKNKFLSNMSHELRTPLNVILGFVQTLKESPNLDHAEQNDLQIVYESSLHLLHLIEDILDISKIEAGKMELFNRDIHLPQFLNNLVESIKPQIERKNINFIYQTSPDLPLLVKADRKRLKQVLLNLLSNALKFTEEGYVGLHVQVNRIKSVTDQSGRSLVSLTFKVEDSGMGIPPEKLELIFLPFEQAGSTSFKLQGTGLGLSISQEIVRMMGGEITVESRWNRGSIFQFTIDLELVPDAHPAEPLTIKSQNTMADQRLGDIMPLKILLAEDNLVNQKVALKMLDKLGYQADVVSNGRLVLEAVQQQMYDVILMDVQMPELDGIEATKQIVQLVEKRPYIIALTANAMTNDRLTCLAAGMDDYVSKPIKLEALIDVLWRSQQPAMRD